MTSKGELERRIAELEQRVTALELAAATPWVEPQPVPQRFITECTVRHPCGRQGFGPCNGWPRDSEQRGNDAMTGLMDDTGTIVRGTE